MKKLFYYMALTLAMAVCMTDFTSCSDDDDQPQIATFSLDMASLDPQYVDQENNCITITEGESAEMIFVVEPAEFAKQIVLTSADESICAVDGHDSNLAFAVFHRKMQEHRTSIKPYNRNARTFFKRNECPCSKRN